MRVLELFSGLGGWRCALGDRGGGVAAGAITTAGGSGATSASGAVLR